MSSIGGPGGIGGPKGPGGPDAATGPDDAAGIDDAAGTPDVGRAGEVDGSAAARAVGELESMAADIAAGRLTAREAVDRLVSEIAGSEQLGQTEQAELRELLSDLVASDPYLASLAGRAG
jgi:hypothetical protein